jgi:hypothetical protein
MELMRTQKQIKKIKITPNPQQKKQMNKIVKSVIRKKKNMKNRNHLKIDRICPKETRSVTKIESAQKRRRKASRVILMVPAVLLRNPQLLLSESSLG